MTTIYDLAIKILKLFKLRRVELRARIGEDCAVFRISMDRLWRKRPVGIP